MGICASGGNTDTRDLELLDYNEELRYFYVVTVIFNPARSRNRIKLYLDFRKQMEKFGIRLITLECAYENAPFTVTSPNYEPYNIQLKTDSPLILKEHLLNIALSKLPTDARYVCLVDYEVEFLNETWINETIKALNMFKAVQLFEDIIFLGPKDEEIVKDKGFAYQLQKKKGADNKTFEETTKYAGYAWGYRVEVLREIGGLIDYSIIGNSEKIMAYCLAERCDEYVPSDVSENFRDSIKNWQKKAANVFVEGFDCISGGIKVNYSNTKRDKSDYERWDILRNNMFDPRNDLERDDNDIYTISKKKPKLLEDMRLFFEAISGEVQDL